MDGRTRPIASRVAHADGLPRVLGHADALRLGFRPAEIRWRLRTGVWHRVLPDTYLTSDTLTWMDRLTAATVFAGPGSLLSGAAALTDLELRSVPTPTRPLVLVPVTTCVRPVPAVRVRRTAHMPATAARPGPPRAAVQRAVADLAREIVALDDVRALVANVVRRRLCTVDELQFELDRGAMRGSAHLRQAIMEVGAGAWSAPEARAANLLRHAEVPAFEQNAPLLLSNGRRVIVDFLWRALRAVLEVDSDAHHSLAGDADATSDRHLWLETDGYSVTHRTPRMIYQNPDGFVTGIERWLDARQRDIFP